MVRERRIGILMPFPAGYIHEVIRGISEAIRPYRAWAVRLAGGFDDWIPQMLAWGPDGVLANATNAEAVAMLKGMGVPVVSFSGGVHEPGLPIVHSNDRLIGAMAAEHLKNLNLEHFAYWAGHDAEFCVQRGLGFFNALRIAGVGDTHLHRPPAQHRLDWAQRDRTIADWLSGLPKPVGLLCSQDAQAYYISDVAREAGLDIPNDIALLGVDDDALMCELAYPPLSSVRLPGREVGIKAVEVLSDLLDGGEAPPDPILLPPIGVVERGSTDMLAIDNRLIAAAVRFIRNHATEGITVADILRHTPMARRTFETQFRRLFGRSPGAEIRRVQIERAKFALLTSDAPMPEVARVSGFCDAAYMSRVFRRETGIAPTQFRHERGVE